MSARQTAASFDCGIIVRVSGHYGISGCRCRDHSGFMPANFTTLPHFSVSSAMKCPKATGEPARTAAPKSASRAFILGSTRPRLISLLSLSTISDGVLLGAPVPYQILASYPGTKSPTVGISGKASDRIEVVTANGRSLPALRYSTEDGRL